MSSEVTLLDYGMCNLLNVARAFEHCGSKVTITEDAELAAKASRLVVPGVGAFRDSMKEVHARGFDGVIRQFIQSGRPFLGICVGMQMLFDGSEEFGDSPGLGVLKGQVRAIARTTVSGEAQRIPHIGWNHLVEPDIPRDWSGTLLQPLRGKHPAVYFVHSFAAVPTDTTLRLADCLYGGHRVCAAVEQGNVMATQFHPERSGETGLRILQRFLEL
jgi:glutamine amidotransferase